MEREHIDLELFHPSDSKRCQKMRFNLGEYSERMLYTVLPEPVCRELGEPFGVCL